MMAKNKTSLRFIMNNLCYEQFRCEFHRLKQKLDGSVKQLFKDLIEKLARQLNERAKSVSYPTGQG